MLEDKIARIQSAETQEEAFARFGDAMLEFGYGNNVYSLMTDHPSVGLKAEHGLVDSYPSDWLDYYNARGYQRDDLVWQRLLQSPMPFFWGDVIDRIKDDDAFPQERKKAAFRILNEGADAGIADGIGISFVNAFGEVAGIAMSRDRIEKERRYEDLAKVYLLATCFHEKFRSFFVKPEPPRLTDREREVLLWAAENKSDAEIAAILGITTPTVRFHWGKIFRKLGVHGRVRAVVLSIQLKLIDPRSILAHYQGR